MPSFLINVLSYGPIFFINPPKPKMAYPLLSRRCAVNRDSSSFVNDGPLLSKRMVDVNKKGVNRISMTFANEMVRIYAIKVREQRQ